MDRCALFVDAGYVLADGAMAVHGTRRRESVSWDYAGLLKQFGSIAADRTRLPVLRCYWYESTAEGQRLADHDTLADLPGVKLRLAKKWPGRKEGVESEIRRDLTTLARNKAVSDVMLVSAEEGLAQVIADVQDMGLRVTLLQVPAADGDASPARALRQECDDIVEVSAEQLQPYVELITGAEPPRADEPEAASADQSPAQPAPALQTAARLTAANGAVNGGGYNGDSYNGDRYNGDRYNGSGYNGQASAGYAQPAAEYQPAAEAPATSPETPAAAAAPAAETAQPDAAQAEQAEAARPGQPEFAPAGDFARNVDYSASVDYGGPAPEQPAADHEPAIDYAAAPEYPAAREYLPAASEYPAAPEYLPAPGYTPAPEYASLVPDYSAPASMPAPVTVAKPAPSREDLYPAPVAVPVPDELAAARLGADRSGYAPGAYREQYHRDLSSRDRLQPVPVGIPDSNSDSGSAQVRRLAARGPGQLPGQPAPGLPPAPAEPAGQQPFSPVSGGPLSGGYRSAGQPTGSQPAVSAASVSPLAPIAPVVPMDPSGMGYAPARGLAPGGPRPAGPGSGGPNGFGGPGSLSGPVGNPLGGQQAPGGPSFTGQAPSGQSFNGQAPGGASEKGSQSGPLGLVGGPGGYSGGAPGVSLADAVQSAHEEGQAFGDSVARDAPALWLEAVLARKPRMPSDLEARLLQGSTLPIDFLLHDEVRHALRRGFWDALERARR